MPRYYFHAADGAQIRDEDGEELTDLEAAKAVAASVMSELLLIRRQSLWDEGPLTVTVDDETGHRVACLTTMATADPVARLTPVNDV